MDPFVHLHDSPQRFVVGTIGLPGQRTFFLQAKSGRRITSVRLEKEQARILGDKIAEMLDELDEVGKTQSGNSPEIAPHLVDREPLDTPVSEDFRVGTMTLSWDDSSARVVVEAFSEEHENSKEVLIVKLTTQQARAFSLRSASVVAGGRPSCVFCGEPIDAEGHLCVRANGFRRRLH